MGERELYLASFLQDRFLSSRGRKETKIESLNGSGEFLKEKKVTGKGQWWGLAVIRGSLILVGSLEMRRGQIRWRWCLEAHDVFLDATSRHLFPRFQHELGEYATRWIC